MVDETCFQSMIYQIKNNDLKLLKTAKAKKVNFIISMVKANIYLAAVDIGKCDSANRLELLEIYSKGYCSVDWLI